VANDTLLEIKGLKTYFFLDEGTVKAVDGADLTMARGGTLGVVGESGCGKSVTAFSILQLVEKPGRITEGQILYHRQTGKGQTEIVDLAQVKPNSRQMHSIRGGEVAMIFQEPMTSLSPVHTIGHQIGEAISLHRRVTREEARRQTIQVLGRVGFPHPEERVDSYPFQLSGGLRQRAMIAMALSCQPSLLIADEPTTALDVTTQAQILELMLELQRDMGMGIMLITHNLGVVAEMCDQVAVMYLGQVAEQASADDVFHEPLHPYTRALLRSIPKLGISKSQTLDPIKGMVPDPYNRPTGCPFHPRCPQRIKGKCEVIEPPITTVSGGRTVRCLLYGGA
jgi:peptide/nickel transport system ATP-binding protein